MYIDYKPGVIYDQNLTVRPLGLWTARRTLALYWAGRLLQIAMKVERNKCHIKTPPNILV